MSGDERVVVFGATSQIAECTCRIFAERGASLVLIGRSEEKLTPIAQDLKVRGAKDVTVQLQDLQDIGALSTLIDSVWADGAPTTVLIAHGVLPDQEAVQDDTEAVLDSYKINLSSPQIISLEVIKRFESLGKGTLAVITSVAGVRARKSNYVYGAAKGALSLFLQGLRNRVGKTAIRVVDIRPGFVDTPMTSHIEKGPLFAAPEAVAAGIVKAVDRGQEIVYLPWFWRWIMLIIRSIPEGIFKKLSL